MKLFKMQKQTKKQKQHKDKDDVFHFSILTKCCVTFASLTLASNFD